jgi:hypothetical protein
MIATAQMTNRPKHPIHTRLVSFENSNSWLKRHDSEGTLVIQAGYRENPSDAALSDDENPIVIMDGKTPRWYGAMACKGSHTRSFERSKIETARESFAACLRASDDGRDLIVVASYWDAKDHKAMEKALLGQYSVIRNGERIHATVTQVIMVLEGIGSYHTVQPVLDPGETLLIEIGFGTAEEWLIDEDGNVIDGRPVTQLGVLNLVNNIAADPTVRATLGNGERSESINLSMISAGLQKPSIGRLSPETWQSIKVKYSAEYLKNLKGYIKTQYGASLQGISNIVLTGGGAALLQSLNPSLTEFFTITANPQIASVVGAYNHQMAKVG